VAELRKLAPEVVAPLEALAAQRQRGVVVEVRDHGLPKMVGENDPEQLNNLLNDFVSAVSRERRCNARWSEAERSSATRILQDNLRYGQAYDDECMPLPAAAALTEGFFGLFAAPRLFTNASYEVDDSSLLRATAWTGTVTGATFEAGIVALDASRIGLLYIADED
jgi:hypothetical protein